VSVSVRDVNPQRAARMRHISRPPAQPPTRRVKNYRVDDRTLPKGGEKSATTECERRYISLINDRDTDYIYRNIAYPIKPSDAFGSAPLTIRNIAMGNLLPIAKSVSRRIRQDAAGCRRHPRTKSSASRGTLRMAPIYYVYDDLASVADLLPLLISRR
jgi:hypothetical protein